MVPSETGGLQILPRHGNVDLFKRKKIKEKNNNKMSGGIGVFM